MMTYPNFPFPPGTPMYPRHEHAESYFKGYASHFNLTSPTLFDHEVLSASWVGTSESGKWSLTVQHQGVVQTRMFDHLVVAAGINRYPCVPAWPGQSEWLANALGGVRREITHAAWYRNPELYTGKRVLVVGAAASGIDLSNQISPFTKEVSFFSYSVIAVNGIHCSSADLHLLTFRAGPRFWTHFSCGSPQGGYLPLHNGRRGL